MFERHDCTRFRLSWQLNIIIWLVGIGMIHFDLIKSLYTSIYLAMAWATACRTFTGTLSIDFFCIRNYCLNCRTFWCFIYWCVAINCLKRSGCTWTCVISCFDDQWMSLLRWFSGGLNLDIISANDLIYLTLWVITSLNTISYALIGYV